MELTTDDYLQSIWMALRRIETNLALPPAPLELPPINIPAPDLTDIVQAVTGLRQTASADDIGRAIAAALAPQDTNDAALLAIADGLKMLEHRLQGFGKQAYGGGTVSLAAGTTFQISGSVEVSNDEGAPLPVRQYSAATAATTRVPSSATAVTLLAMNTARNQATIYNESTQVLYIKFGAGASTTDYTLPIAGSGYYEFPVRYGGEITGIWASANGFAQLTEF